MTRRKRTSWSCYFDNFVDSANSERKVIPSPPPGRWQSHSSQSKNPPLNLKDFGWNFEVFLGESWNVGTATTEGMTLTYPFRWLWSPDRPPPWWPRSWTKLRHWNCFDSLIGKGGLEPTESWSSGSGLLESDRVLSARGTSGVSSAGINIATQAPLVRWRHGRGGAELVTISIEILPWNSNCDSLLWWKTWKSNWVVLIFLCWSFLFWETLRAINQV